MKRHVFWIVEVLVWILILFLISGSFIVAKNYKKHANTYQIFMPDVDGLINGSPVKLMGIQIGYVSQIDIVGDDVYIKFVITENKVKIPYGTKATVEFSGLGGSKSLELYPPNGDPNPSGKFIIVQNPKRISDSVGLLSNMFDQVIEIAYTVSNFMDKVGLINEKEYNGVESSNSINNILDSTNTWLDDANKKCKKLNNKLNHKKGIKDGKNYTKNRLEQN